MRCDYSNTCVKHQYHRGSTTRQSHYRQSLSKVIQIIKGSTDLSGLQVTVTPDRSTDQATGHRSRNSAPRRRGFCMTRCMPFQQTFSTRQPEARRQRRNTLRVTSKATYEGRATEQCGLTPTPSVCTALSLEQAPTGQSKQSMSASRQSIHHACPPSVERQSSHSVRAAYRM